MAAVVDIRTVNRCSNERRPELVLIESPIDWQRIYLRRRLVVLAAGLMLVLAVVLIGGHALSGLNDSPATVRVHTVQPDETLWSIAKGAMPGHDPRVTIATMVELNSTVDATFDAWAPIAVGQRIRVPADR